MIATGMGNCHIYIDRAADLEHGLEVVLNAKTQRPGVCNAETLWYTKKWRKLYCRVWRRS